MFPQISLAKDTLDQSQTNYPTFEAEVDVDDALGASNSNFCEARVILHDWQDGFKSNTSAFDWCFDRVRGWGLDSSDGWKSRYCHLGSYRNNNYNYFNMRFNHHDRDYSARYQSSIFFTFESDYSRRVFQGFSLKVQLEFSARCNYD